MFVQRTKEHDFITFKCFLAQAEIKDVRVLWPYVRDLGQVPFHMLHSFFWGWQILCLSSRGVSREN